MSPLRLHAVACCMPGVLQTPRATQQRNTGRNSCNATQRNKRNKTRNASSDVLPERRGLARLAERERSTGVHVMFNPITLDSETPLPHKVIVGFVRLVGDSVPGSVCRNPTGHELAALPEVSP